jgi:hypothetical protein
MEKSAVKTSSLSKKSYTPDIETSEKVIIIVGNLSRISCNNSNNQTAVQKYVIVKNEIIYSNESVINITDVSPESTSFGDSVNVKLNIFKGDTKKTSVHVYIQGEEKLSEITYLNLDTKNQEYDLTVPVQIKPNCNKRYGDGRYKVIAEGLDTRSERDIILSGISSSLCIEIIKTQESSSASKSTGVSLPPATKLRLYQLLSYDIVKEKSKLKLFLLLTNQDNSTHNYTVSNYLYQGKTSFPDDREKNDIIISLPPESEKTITLENNLLNVTSGEYGLKIKILREDRKTPYEITENITIPLIALKPKSNPEIVILSEQLSVKNISQLESNKQERMYPEMNKTKERKNEITGDIIYESSTEKLKGYGIYFLLFIFAAGAVAFFFMREKR